MTTKNPFDAATKHLPAISHYEIVDRHTGKVVGRAKTRAAASRSVDKRDNAYGAYRFTAHVIYATDADVALTLNAHLAKGGAL